MDEIGKMLGGATGASGASGSGGAGDLAGAIGGLMGGQGGLQGLVDQLSKGGLGNEVSSWVGTGANQPVDPQALGQALGPDTVNQLAGKTGLDVSTLLPMLAAALPSVINAVTPDGKVPQGNAAGGIDIGSVLGGLKL
jgi:uncharacterized protein YidB (DUF937 family)